MRNHNDVTRILLQRRDDYEAAQKRKRKLCLKIGSFAACFCLIAVIGIGAGYGGLLKKPEGQLANSADSSIIGTEDDLDREQDINVNIINSNTISDSAKKLNVNLRVSDRIVLSSDEALEYYGTNIFPKVPEDLNAWEGQDKFNVYKRDGGTGEAYYDTFCLNYSSSDFKRCVNIEGAKGDYPLSDTGNWELNDFKPSEINGQEVYIALNTDTEHYFVKFMYNNVAFQIIMEDLTEDEVVSVVSSLIK